MRLLVVTSLRAGRVRHARALRDTTRREIALRRDFFATQTQRHDRREEHRADYHHLVLRMRPL